MSPEERQLIAGLFERMRSFGPPEKDREAEALINQSVRAMPDAAYMLVQSVLVQEQGLQASQDRIQELEERVRQLEGGQQPATKSGSFLGGFWGGKGDPEPRAGSVPQVGARATPSTYERRSPWAQQDAGAPPPQAQQPQATSNGGGFMRSALTTAAGVAGGMLVADGLRNMLGGAHANPAAAAAAAPQTGGEGRQDANYAAADDRQQDQDQDQDDEDDADTDSGFDSGGELDI